MIPTRRAPNVVKMPKKPIQPKRAAFMYRQNSVQCTTMARTVRPNGLENRWNVPENELWSKKNTHCNDTTYSTGNSFLTNQNHFSITFQFKYYPRFERRMFGYADWNNRWFTCTAALDTSTKGEGRVWRSLSYTITCHQSRKASSKETYHTRWVRTARTIIDISQKISYSSDTNDWTIVILQYCKIL